MEHLNGNQHVHTPQLADVQEADADVDDAFGTLKKGVGKVDGLNGQ